METTLMAADPWQRVTAALTEKDDGSKLVIFTDEAADRTVMLKLYSDGKWEEI